MRERAESTASAHGHPINVRIYRLTKPNLSISHSLEEPELPSLPQPQLVLPKPAQQAPVYVGEEFKGLVIVQLHDAAKDTTTTSLPSLSSPSHLRIEVEAPDGSKEELYTGEILLNNSEDTIANSNATKVNFELNLPGTWTLRTSIRYDTGVEEQVLRKMFKIEAMPAISVRTKVSKSSSVIKAHVLEAQIENLTEYTLFIETCALNAANGWTASSLATDESTVSTGGGIVLRPRDVHQWVFVLRFEQKQAGQAPSEVGPLSIGWRREPLGTKGWQTTGSIRI